MEMRSTHMSSIAASHSRYVVLAGGFEKATSGCVATLTSAARSEIVK